MKRVVLVVVGSALLGGCMKPAIEQVIKGDERLTVHSDVNWFSPSFTWPVREKCIKQDGVTTVTKIDDKEYVCYGTYVEVQHTAPGFEEGAGGKVVGGGVTMMTGLGAAALIGPGGLAKMGDKDSNNTTNNNDTESHGGQTINSNANLNQAVSSSKSSAASSSFSKSSSHADGGSVNYGKHRR